MDAALTTDTHVAHEDLLCGFEVPLDLTVHRMDDDNAVVGEDIEHVSHTEAWAGGKQHGQAPRGHPQAGYMQRRTHRMQAPNAIPGRYGRDEWPAGGTLLDDAWGTWGERDPKAETQDAPVHLRGTKLP